LKDNDYNRKKGRGLKGQSLIIPNSKEGRYSMRKATAVWMMRAVCASALIVMVIFASCGGKGGDDGKASKGESAKSGGDLSELVGRWGSPDSDHANNKLELFKDGTGITSERAITWKVDGERFVITATENGTVVSNAVNYKLSGDMIIFTSDNGSVDTLVRMEKLGDIRAKRAAEQAERAAEEAGRAAAAEREAVEAAAREAKLEADRIAAVQKRIESLPKFTDSRDGKSYRKVKIGNQTWMAENLNYHAPGSRCYGENGKVLNYGSGLITLPYGEIQENCAKYGRLYDWKTAMNESTGGGKVQGVCPPGWHLPSDAEWETLVENAGGWSVAGGKLKSVTGWEYGGNGTDDYGFSALPGGIYTSYGDGDNFYSLGSNGHWQSTTEYNDEDVFCRCMTYADNTVRRYYDDKRKLSSVRCVED